MQHKAIAHPTDSKLLETSRVKLVEAAKEAGIPLKQTYAKEVKALSRKAGRYAPARQFRRMRRTLKRQRTVVGRLLRDIERKASALNEVAAAVKDSLPTTLLRAAQIVMQSASNKAKDGAPKLCSFHAPEVSCINKGKSEQPYEFGVKVGIASTLQGNLIVGARAFHGNTYDGHTLNEQLEQASILMQGTGVKPTTAFVDLGYRGVDANNPDVHIVHRGKTRRITEEERQLLKLRQAIKPIIGHLEQDHRMDRCHFKAEVGDRLHAVLCAAGYNLKRLLRMIVKKGITFLSQLFCACAQRWPLSTLRLDGQQNSVQWTHNRYQTGCSWLEMNISGSTM